MTRALRLLGESARIALSQPAPTAVTVLIVAVACGVIVSTTGQTVAIERDVLSRIDDAGTRTIVVEDVDGRAQLRAEAIDRINALGDVEWAVGFGLARDVRPAGLVGAPPVPIRALFGTLPSDVTSSGGSWEPGTALAGLDAISALGMETAAGPVELMGEQRPIGLVGWFEAAAPLDFLNRSLLTGPTAGESVIRIFVVVRTAERVADVNAAIATILDPAEPTSVAIRTSERLVEVRAAVQGQLGAFGRDIVAATLAAGLVLTVLNVFAAVTARRRDFGRRRALGASRMDLAALVIMQMVPLAALGAVLGGIVGTLVVHQLTRAAPQADFTVAVGILAVAATTVAGLPPAALAAYRDPVRVLRVP